MLFKYTYAFVILPGGVGTMDEFFEAITLIQTKKIDHFPIVLVGTEYWSTLLTQLEYMAQKGAISPEDMKLVLITDDVNEAMAFILQGIRDRFSAKK